MTTVLVAIALAAAAFPASTPEVASYRISIHEGMILDTEVQAQDIPAGAAEAVTASFANVADGSYTALAQAMAADGTKIGSAMQQSFKAAAPDVTRMIPSSVTVTLSA